MDPLWKSIRVEYKLLEEMGQGSYGQVIKAMHRQSKQVVAIKLMKNIFADSYQARKTLREIKILRKLSRIPNNLFTTALMDVILPEGIDLNKFQKKLSVEEQKGKDKDDDAVMQDDQDISIQQTAIDKTKFSGNESEHNLQNLTHVFLVMELVDSDMKKLMSS